MKTAKRGKIDISTWGLFDEFSEKIVDIAKGTINDAIRLAIEDDEFYAFMPVFYFPSSDGTISGRRKGKTGHPLDVYLTLPLDNGDNEADEDSPVLVANIESMVKRHLETIPRREECLKILSDELRKLADKLDAYEGWEELKP